MNVFTFFFGSFVLPSQNIYKRLFMKKEITCVLKNFSDKKKDNYLNTTNTFLKNLINDNSKVIVCILIMAKLKA